VSSKGCQDSAIVDQKKIEDLEQELEQEKESSARISEMLDATR